MLGHKHAIHTCHQGYLIQGPSIPYDRTFAAAVGAVAAAVPVVVGEVAAAAAAAFVLIVAAEIVRC